MGIAIVSTVVVFAAVAVACVAWRWADKGSHLRVTFRKGRVIQSFSVEDADEYLFTKLIAFANEYEAATSRFSEWIPSRAREASLLAKETSSPPARETSLPPEAPDGSPKGQPG